MKKKIYKDYTILHYEALDSTNDKAQELAKQGLKMNKTVVISDIQNKGRGRNNRKWESYPGNLFASIILFLNNKQKNIHELSFLIAIAINEAIRCELKNSKIKIENKWPNDIVVDSKKISGTLIESQFQNNEILYNIVGVGINIKNKPLETIFPACCINDFSKEISVENILQNFLDNLDKFLLQWQNFGFLPIRNKWLENAWNINKEVSIITQSKKITGIFENIDSEGNIEIKSQDGLIKLNIGDVTL